MSDSNDERTAALRRCLALHDELLWILGHVGGRFSDLKKQARATFVDQRRARDDLRAAVDGDDRPTAPPAYDTQPPKDIDAAINLVRSSIDQQLEAYLVLIGLTDTAARMQWIDALRAGARQQIEWGSQPLAYPGLDRHDAATAEPENNSG